MNKELQDYVWSILPKEFKEEVQFEYHRVATKASKEEYDLGFIHAHVGMFGFHNLTSDAEGEEELLTVQRSKVIDVFTQNTILLSEGHSEYLSGYYNGKCHVLKDLFGSKCLPDEVAHEDNFASKEPQPAEPKFKEGDRAIYCIPEKQRIKARVVNVRQRSGSTLFNTLFNYDIRLDDGRTVNWVDEQWLLPDNDDQVRAVTEKASEQFDNILAKDLCKARRLRIAAQLMAAMMSNPMLFNKSITVEDEDIVHGSLEYADALIEAVEKGDSK